MASIHLSYLADEGCSWHRFLQPARFCAPDFAPMGHDILVGPTIDKEAEWIGIHALPNDIAVFELARAHRRGQKVLWSVDDDWLTVPDWNPAAPGFDGLVIYDMLKDIADLILCSTPYLAATFDDVREKVVTAPNLIDLATFPVPPSVMKAELPVRVVWVGGRTHKEDIEVITNVVGAMINKLTMENVSFVYMGMQPPHPLTRDFLRKGLMYQPPVPFQQYQRVVNTLAPDVWLAPLADVPFNHSKSNLRIMEGWALMSAPCASRVSEYNCIRPGIDGRLAGSEDEWISALTRLVTDHTYRMDMIAEGRKRVEIAYDWNRWECRRSWHDVFARMLECDLPTRRD
jgi:hypothetical protein